MNEIQDQTGIAVRARGQASALELKLAAQDVTIEQALDMLKDSAPDKRLIWRKAPDGNYEIWDEQGYNTEVLPTLVEQKIFIPTYISADDLYKSIESAKILTDKVGAIAEDARTNQVIVTDLPEVLSLVQDLVNLIDQPQYTRRFYIQYANVKDVADKIKDFKSEPGRIDVDEKLHLIIVTDILSNIERMDSMIELLDNHTIRRVYKLNSIGGEDEDIDTLEAALKESFLSEGAYFFIDKTRGLLFVEDTLEKQDDVMRFLELFNSPVPQVLIQAELVEVSQGATLKFGTEWTYQDDIGTSVSATGFSDLTKKFPIITGGSGGLIVNELTDDVKALFTAVMTDTSARVLLRPEIQVKNRQPANLTAGGNLPIANTVYLPNTSGSTTYIPQTSQQNIPVGLEVDLTPTISPTGLVEIDIRISNINGKAVEIQSGGQTSTAVQTTNDTAETIMIVPDGETRVISGLIRRNNTNSDSGIPYLVRIPYIGPALFGTKNNSDEGRNLLFFITPTIVREKPNGSIIAYDFDMTKGMPRASERESLKPRRTPISELPAPEFPMTETTPTLMERTPKEKLIPGEEGYPLGETIETPAPGAIGPTAQTPTIPEASSQASSQGERFYAPLPYPVTPETEFAPTVQEETSPTAANSEEGLRQLVEQKGGKFPESKKVSRPTIHATGPSGPGQPAAPGQPQPAPQPNAAPAPTPVPAAPVASAPSPPQLPSGAAPTATPVASGNVPRPTATQAPSHQSGRVKR